MPEVSNTAAIISSAAAIVSSSLAALGLFATALQIKRNRDFQRENTAKGIYRDYLKMAIDNPVLAEGELPQIRECNKMEQYKWFVSYLLWASEEIIDFAPSDSDWRKDITSQLEYHKGYLGSSEFRRNEFSFYSSELRTLLNELTTKSRTA